MYTYECNKMNANLKQAYPITNLQIKFHKKCSK